MTEFSERVAELISSIPAGRATTYGAVAAAAGSPRGARQVARILHSCSRSRSLPWHRVVGSRGRIALPEGGGRELQASLLAGEGMVIDDRPGIDLSRFGWDFPLSADS